MDQEVRYGQLSVRRRAQCLPYALHEVDEINIYIMILRVQVMFYNLDRVTCEETIVDKFLLTAEAGPAAPESRPPCSGQPLAFPHSLALHCLSVVRNTHRLFTLSLVASL